jgi:hypothetical protein
MILVDEVRHYPDCRWKHKYWSHMVTDTDFEELHAMARALGLKKEWFQGDHYDVTPKYREKAIKLGAVPTTSRDLVKRRKRK